MSKNIILLSDGTGNGAAKRNKTNVWRLYDVLDLHRDDQIACYDDGVGSKEFMLAKLLGGAFGWGLARNVRELYQYLCRSYKPGDRIYLFGFSRGAFTVRTLAGMVAHCGLHTSATDKRHLEQVARDNYNAFRDQFKRGWLTRFFRVFFGRKEPVAPDYTPGIEFIGVWDTVDAYGMPIDEMAGFWDRFIYQIRFPDFKLWHGVKKACHAVSVDDERHTFHPVLWDESGETDPDRIEQVWFPGVHSDVGGGYPEDTLALVSLDWMIAKAEATQAAIGSPGLHLISRRREEIVNHSDWHGPQHNSRALAGVYYRYKPRDIETLCKDKKNGVCIQRPKIHRSVMERIAGDVIAYAPIGLPETYDPVATRGTAPVYETPVQAAQRKTAMAPVKRVIAFRRGVYFTMLTISLTFVLSPAWVRFLDKSRFTPLYDLLDKGMVKAMGLLPDVIAPWIQVLREYSEIFYALVLIFSVFAVLKAKAWAKTQQIATDAWAVLKREDRAGG